MKTFADVKRRMTVGTAVMMEKYVVSGRECGGKLVGVARKIKQVQTNGIQFEPTEPGKDGSWLYWPRAKDVQITGPDTFIVGGEGPHLHYRFV